MTRPDKVPQHSATPWSTRTHNRYVKEYAFTFRTILVARRYRALLDDRLRPLGYGTARMETLTTIAHSHKLSAQTEIAKRIGIEGPTLTRMLDALENEGLVERLPDPGDRRTKLIQLTDAGHKALKEIMEVADAVRRDVVRDMTDEELDAVNDVNAKLLSTLHDRAFE